MRVLSATHIQHECIKKQSDRRCYVNGHHSRQSMQTDGFLFVSSIPGMQRNFDRQRSWICLSMTSTFSCRFSWNMRSRRCCKFVSYRWGLESLSVGPVACPYILSKLNIELLNCGLGLSFLYIGHRYRLVEGGAGRWAVFRGCFISRKSFYHPITCAFCEHLWTSLRECDFGRGGNVILYERGTCGFFFPTRQSMIWGKVITWFTSHRHGSFAMLMPRSRRHSWGQCCWEEEQVGPQAQSWDEVE